MRRAYKITTESYLVMASETNESDTPSNRPIPGEVRPRILVVQQTRRGGGAEQVAQHWASSLTRLGLIVEMAFLDETKGVAGAYSLGHEGMLKAFGTGSRDRARALRSLIKRRDYKYVLSLLTYPNLLCLLAGWHIRETRVIVSEHNVPSILLRGGSWKHIAQLYLAKVLYRRARGVIAVSHATATDLRSNFGVRGVALSVLPNALFGTPAPKPSRRLIDESLPIEIIVPGRLAKQKRPDVALASLSWLVRHGYNARLHFVGDPYRDYDASSIPDDGVVVSGWDSNWSSSAILRPNTVVLLPSEVEGFGNVLVVAASVGLPVAAASASLGVSDAVLPGITGYLASVDTPEAIARAVLAAHSIEEIPPNISGWIELHSGPAVDAGLALMLANTEL
jgi:glycosyltransferase involved in cell wall biosynthesis